MSVGYRSVVLNIIGKDNASKAFLSSSRAADNAATRIDRSMRTIAATSAKMQAVGQRMTKFITLPILAAVAISIKEAVQFQKSMTTIQVITGQSDAQIAKSSAGLKKIAVETGSSLSQLTAGLYMVEKGGFRGQKALDIVTAAAKGAKAENVDLGVATNALTSIMASYGKALGDPVQAMNMIIKGSGLSKTTMQDFANSLSNVVPIAASLHVRFADVAAAIATMTQHGETAQHATENLRNLISNLAGQNNVASQAMQQLGINTVNLRENLGKRGLVGTLDVVLNAVKRTGKSGVVVVDTFKKAALATASLKTMMGTFNGVLKTNSDSLLKGKMGYKDYRTYARSLGGQAGASAQQFLALYLQTYGFSNLLKSGKGKVLTYATALQQMLGGLTGMNVALQLSGSSAGTFHRNAKSVQDAAQNANGQVLGWSKVQQTLAVQFDILKQKLIIAATNIGTVLLPVVSKIVGKIGDWVSDFEHLSKKTQGVLIKLGLLVTVLGPMLAILGRLGRLIIGMLTIGLFVSRFVAGMLQAQLSIKGMETAAYGAGLRMRTGFGTALTGLNALKLGLASLAIGLTVGTFARGASTSTKLFAGLGAAGAGAAVGFSMGGGWGAAIGGLVGGLSSLGASFLGTGKSAQDSAEMSEQALANEKASIDSLTESLKSTNDQYNLIYRNATINALSHSKSGRNILQEGQKLGVDPKLIVDYAMGRAGKGADNTAGLILKQLKASGAGLGAQDRFLQALNSVAGDVGKAQAAYELYQAALGKGVVPTKLLAGGLKNLASELRGTGTMLDVAGTKYENTSGYAKKNTEVIRENVKQIQAQAEKQLAAGKDTGTVAANLDRSMTGLRKQLVDNLGFKPAQVDALLKKFGKIPKSLQDAFSRQLLLKIKSEPAKRAIADVQRLIQGIRQGYVPILGVNTEAALALISQLQMYINGLKDHTVTITAHYKAVHGPGSSTYNQQVPYFQGGNGGGAPRANGGALPEGFFTVGERGYELGYKRGGHVMIYDNKTSKDITGMDRVPGFASGTGVKSSPSKLKDTVSAISAFLAVAHNLISTSADMRDAAKTLRDAAKTDKLRAGQQATILKTTNRLTSLTARRDSVMAQLGTPPTRATAYDALATAQDAYNTSRTGTRSAFTGAVDTTSIGQNSWGVASSGKIATDLASLASKAKRFASVLKKLIKLGLPRGVVEQLAQAGPSALAQAEAFASVTPGQLKSIKSSYAAIDAAGKSAGTAVADAYYGSDVAKAKATVERLLGSKKSLDRAIRTVADDLVRELEHELGIKLSPSLGKPTHNKPKAKHLSKADAEIAQIFHIHGITDPEALARAIARRLARTVA